MKNIGVIIGSLRKASFNRQVAQHLVAEFGDKANFEIVEISQLPLYNQDLDDEGLDVYTDFRKKIRSLDAVVFVTPEYNRSVPAALKNALDIASRPKVENAWDNIPCGIISCSPGRLGAFGANHHLRQSLSFLNMPTLLQPEMYFSEVKALLENKEKLNRYLGGFVDALLKFIDA